MMMGKKNKIFPMLNSSEDTAALKSADFEIQIC